MQLTLILSGADAPLTLPLASSQLIQGLIYHALVADPAYAGFLHEQGNTDGNRKFKLFCFSELMPSGRYAVDTAARTITYFSDVSLEIRSAQPYFIGLLFSHFNSHHAIQLGSCPAVIRAVRLEDDRIFAGQMQVRTLSPVTVYRTEPDGHTTYFSPHEDAFYRAVETGARRKWRSVHGTEDGFSLSVRPVDGARYARRMTRFKSTFITAWHGEFVLEGNPQTLDFLYQTGIGSKNSQGFGLFRQV